MTILENYLKCLNENGYWNVLKAAGKEQAISGAKNQFWYGLVIAPAVWASWRLLGKQFSQAAEKCGTFTRGPGRNVCIQREKIKILQQRLKIAKTLLSQCGTAKDSDLCQQKTNMEIEKINNRLELAQNKIKEELGGVNEIEVPSPNDAVKALPFLSRMPARALQAGSFIGIGSLLTVAGRLAWRSALGIVSKQSRSCGTYKTGPERDGCLSKYKLISLIKRIEILKSSFPNCDKKEDPADCKEKLQKNIDLMKNQIQIQKDNIRIYGNQATEKKQSDLFKQSKKV
jgi:predicted ribosome quality control (RQC) complex YloA/Tae2 family protein